MPSSDQTNHPYYSYSNRSNQSTSFSSQQVYQSVNGKGNSNGIQNHPPEENDRRRHSEWTKPEVIIAGIGLILSIVLGYVTYQLFLKTIEANEISGNALKEAKRANDETERTNKRNYIRDTANDRAQEEKDKFNIEVSRQTLETQINSVKETQRQFKLANQPYLQVSEPTLPTIESSQPISISYYITNLRETPAKLISQQGRVYAYNNKTQKILDTLIREHLSANLIYITNQRPLSLKTPAVTLTDFGANRLNSNPDIYLLFVKEFVYENLTDKSKKRIYTFRMLLKPVSGSSIYANNTYSKILFNENIDAD